jgi:hypothetical protein
MLVMRRIDGRPKAAQSQLCRERAVGGFMLPEPRTELDKLTRSFKTKTSARLGCASKSPDRTSRTGDHSETSSSQAVTVGRFVVVKTVPPKFHLRCCPATCRYI